MDGLHRYADSLDDYAKFADTSISPDMYTFSRTERIDGEFSSKESVFEYLRQFIAKVQKNLYIFKTYNELTGFSFEFMSHTDIVGLLSNRIFKVPSQSRNRQFDFVPGTAYLKSGMVLEYRSIEFDPDQNAPPDVWNQFKGFPFMYDPDFEVDMAVIEPFLWHMQHIICSGDEGLFSFLRDWIAHLFQKPGIKPQSACLMKSIEGTGKSMFWNIIRQLIGPQWVGVADNEDRVMTRFNSALTFKLLILTQEVTFGGNHKTSNYLKTLITDPETSFEKKGLDAVKVKSCERWVFMSNNDWPVRISEHDRRYTCFEVSPAKVGDKEYFQRLAAFDSKDHPGLIHLYHWFMRVDDIPDVIRPVFTSLKRTIQDISADPTDLFLRDCVDENSDFLLEYPEYCLEGKLASMGYLLLCAEKWTRFSGPVYDKADKITEKTIIRSHTKRRQGEGWVKRIRPGALPNDTLLVPSDNDKAKVRVYKVSSEMFPLLAIKRQKL